ncbi:hypothetical protein ALQ86_05510, partial [Pseudomonas amygdali pv. eriobotryae]
MPHRQGYNRQPRFQDRYSTMPICSIHPLPYSADPIAFFARIREAPGAVLLDSGRPTAERGRYDL